MKFKLFTFFILFNQIFSVNIKELTICAKLYCYYNTGEIQQDDYISFFNANELTIDEKKLLNNDNKKEILLELIIRCLQNDDIDCIYNSLNYLYNIEIENKTVDNLIEIIKKIGFDFYKFEEKNYKILENNSIIDYIKKGMKIFIRLNDSDYIEYICNKYIDEILNKNETEIFFECIQNINLIKKDREVEFIYGDKDLEKQINLYIENKDKVENENVISDENESENENKNISSDENESKNDTNNNRNIKNENKNTKTTQKNKCKCSSR